MIKQLTEAALAAELETHIDSEPTTNRKNGKTIKSTSGSFLLDTPRDRSGSFEPQLIKTHQTHMSAEIERALSEARKYSGVQNFIALWGVN